MEILILLTAWIVAAGSPGPATLAIAGTAMRQGRVAGIAVAAGITTGSAFWGLMAALGMNAVMMSHIWLWTGLRYAGALYLMYLGYKALRSAFRDQGAIDPKALEATSFVRLWTKGALIHLTNPKAMLGWGGLFAVAVPADAAPHVVWETYAMLAAASAFVFFGYGVLFSAARISAAYARARRWFEAVFGVLFGAAGATLFITKGPAA